MSDLNSSTLIERVTSSLRGKQCWYASCGGAAASTFQLAFGERVERQRPIRNPAHSEEYRKFEGEVNLLVWCTWRLDGSAAPITSSDDTQEHFIPALEALVDQTVVEASARLPGWDLSLQFSNGHTLHVFCDHMEGDPSFGGNWELIFKDDAIVVDVSSRCEVLRREA